MKLMFWVLLVACLPSIGWVGNCISGDVIVRMTPPPGREMTPHGERCTGYPIEELFFEKPDGWETTRSLIDYFCYYDHVFDNNFGDYELTVIFAMLFQWQVPLALEVSVLKDFCPTGLEGYSRMVTRCGSDSRACVELKLAFSRWTNLFGRLSTTI
ncbi:hypothetical protein KA005_34865 [bacterium]|nr:hypothetical protein [bacterium]